MKIIIVLLISVMFVGFVFFENSYGMTTESQKKPTPKIFFQLELRDKNGHLYGYVQPVLQIFDRDRTVAWVAQRATNSSVVFEGQNYLLMKYDEPYTDTHFNQYGGYFLNVPVHGQMRNVFYAYYDSVLTNAGDNGRSYWEVLIPSR